MINIEEYEREMKDRGFSDVSVEIAGEIIRVGFSCARGSHTLNGFVGDARPKDFAFSAIDWSNALST